MEINYGEEKRNQGVDLNDPSWDIPGEIMATDSANWHKDSVDMKEGDIVLDECFTSDFVRIPFLVIKHNGKKCLLGFIFGSEEEDYDIETAERKPDDECFDESFINNSGQSIHPITRELVKVL